MTPDPIDFSRYRVAEAIAEQYAAGEPVVSLAGQYEHSEYAIELILAAFDRSGKWEPK